MCITIIGWGNDPTDPDLAVSSEEVFIRCRAAITVFAQKDPVAAQPRHHDLDEMFKKYGDCWPEKRLGIVSRQYYPKGTTANDISLIALKKAIWRANLNDSSFQRSEAEPPRLGALYAGSSSITDLYPSQALFLANALGLNTTQGYDISSACATGMDALIAAIKTLKCDPIQYAAVSTGEVVGSVTNDFLTKNAAIWGDGGGAAILHKEESGNNNYGFLGYLAFLVPELIDTTRSRGIGAHPDHRTFFALNNTMEGRGGETLYRFVLEELPALLVGWLKSHPKVDLQAQPTYLLPHNAMAGMIEGLGEAMGKIDQAYRVPHANVLHRLHDRGNQSSASILSTLAHYADQGVFTKGDLLLLVGFSGTNLSVLLYRWSE